MAKQSERRGYHHGDLRAALLLAAGELLERDGPEAISFRAVARAAGVSQTAPYNHFAGKEVLLAALAADGFSALAASQQRALSGAPGEARIKALGTDYIRFAAAQPQCYRLMFGAGVGDWRAYPEVEAAKSASFRPIRDALAALAPGARRVSAETLDATAVAAWALVHGLSMLMIDGSLNGGRKQDSLAQQAIARFARALASDAAWS